MLLHVCDIATLWRHHEAQTLTSRGDSSRPSNSVYILLDLTREIPLHDPLDMLEVKTPRGHICTDQQACLSFVEAKVVLLPLTMVHVSMELVDLAIEDLPFVTLCLFFTSLGLLLFKVDNRGTCLVLVFIMSSFLVDTFGPVCHLADMGQEVHRLTVAGEHDHLLVLVSEHKHQEVQQSILSRYFHPELLDLPWY